MCWCPTTTATKQTSAEVPSLAVYGQLGEASKLYLAFVAANGSNEILVCSLAAGGVWSAAKDTGQSCHFSPSLAVLAEAAETLCLVFAAANGSKELFLSSLDANGNWSFADTMNQSWSERRRLHSIDLGREHDHLHLDDDIVSSL